VQAGDIIVQFNFKDIKTPNDLQSAVKAAASGSKVPMLIQRDGNTTFLALELPKS
jgi:S1-C subfamily serine protease